MQTRSQTRRPERRKKEGSRGAEAGRGQAKRGAAAAAGRASKVAKATTTAGKPRPSPRNGGANATERGRARPARKAAPDKKKRDRPEEKAEEKENTEKAGGAVEQARSSSAPENAAPLRAPSDASSQGQEPAKPAGSRVVTSKRKFAVADSGEEEEPVKEGRFAGATSTGTARAENQSAADEDVRPPLMKRHCPSGRVQPPGVRNEASGSISDSDSDVVAPPVSRRRHAVDRGRTTSRVVRVASSDEDEPSGSLEDDLSRQFDDDARREREEKEARERARLQKMREEQEELEEEFRELDQTVVRSHRTRERAGVSSYGRALQALKQRKSSHRDARSEAREESISEETPVPGEVEDKDDDGDDEGASDNEDDGESVDETVSESGDESQTEKGNLRDFIVEKDEDELQPVELPAEFSLSSMDVAVAFKTLIRCYIRGAVDPCFLQRVYDDPDSELRTALNAVERRLQVFEQSLVASSLWSTEYKMDLETFPILRVRHVDSQSGCDACNRLDRTATRCLTLTGTPYNRITFQPIQTRLHKAKYVVGRYCSARSRLYHELQHVRFQLFERVEAEVQLVLEREDLPQDTDGQVSLDDVISSLENSGFVDKLYESYELLFDKAGRGYARAAEEYEFGG